jgi:hypothetical protein
MEIDFDDFEYSMPGEHLRLATEYDLRTGPERLHAQADDHQRRLASLEQRLRHVETMLHLLVNRADETADSV